MPALAAPALVGLGVSAEVAGPLSSILFTGVSIALSIIFAPKVPKPEAGRVPFKQSVPPRIRIIGQRRTAGAYMLYHATDDGTFYGVVALCEGTANEFIRYYLNDNVVNLTTPPTVDSYGNGRYGDGKVKIYTRLGVNPETAYSAATSVLGSIWTSDFRGDGICSAIMVAADAGEDNQSTRFPFGLPVPSFIVDATQVFDPRTTAQDWTDPTTWSGTGNDNPILQAMWFLSAPVAWGGIGMDFEEAFLPVLDAITDQVDICDEQVPLKSGTGDPQNRYTGAVLYQFSDDPGDVLAAILGACDGFCCENGDGTITLKAGKWDDDDFSVVIQPKHVLSINLKLFKPDEDEVTGVIVKYNSVPHEYTSVDAPVWPRDAYMGGNDRRIRTIDVDYCNDGYQAQRLSKRVATYEMSRVTGTVVLKMFGIQLVNKRGVAFELGDDEPLLDGVKARLTRVEPNLVDGTVAIDFQVFDPVVCDAWDPDTEQGPLQKPLSVPVEGGFSTPVALTAVTSLISGAHVLEVQFDPGDVAGDDTEYAYRWRLEDTGGGHTGPWVNGNISDVDREADDTWVVDIRSIPDDVIQVQLRAHQHDYSEWSAILTGIDTTVLAPGRPVGFTAVLAGANVDLDWTAAKSANMDHAIVYRNTAGGGIGTASNISGDIANASNTAGSYTDVAPASGTYDYWVVAETSSTAPIASLARGPETVTVP